MWVLTDTINFTHPAGCLLSDPTYMETKERFHAVI